MWRRIHQRKRERRLTVIELFSIHTIVNEYSGHRDVKFTWFRSEDLEVPLVPYAQAVRDYDPYDNQRAYAEGAVNELFSRDEAEALKAWLDQHHGDEGPTSIKKRDLPLNNNVMGVSGMPIGGGPDRYTLWREPNYTLPFKAEGFFDLRDHERIDRRENFAKFSSLLDVTQDGRRVNVAREMERLLSEHSDWTTEQAFAEVKRSWK
jgi:hypothetical protein